MKEVYPNTITPVKKKTNKFFFNYQFNYYSFHYNLISLNIEDTVIFPSKIYEFINIKDMINRKCVFFNNYLIIISFTALLFLYNYIEDTHIFCSKTHESFNIEDMINGKYPLLQFSNDYYLFYSSLIL